MKAYVKSHGKNVGIEPASETLKVDVTKQAAKRTLRSIRDRSKIQFFTNSQHWQYCKY